MLEAAAGAAGAVAVAVAAAVLLASQFTASKTTFLGVGLVVLNLAPKPWLTAPGVGAEAMDCSSASGTRTSRGGPSLAGDSVGVVRVVTMVVV